MKRVSFEEVMAVFHKEHDKDRGSNEWALGVLSDANQQFGGNWIFKKLKRKEALSIVLPWHGHWEGQNNIILIPKEGMTLGTAIKRYNSIKNYKSENPKCWDTIEYLMNKKDSSSVFLSTAPIKGYKVFEDLKECEGHLIHMDGLHRLIAWGVSGRLGFWRYFFGKKIKAYIATSK